MAFGLGFGILTQVMLVLGMAGVSYTVFNISAVLIFIWALFFLLSRIKRPCRPSPRPSKRDSWWTALDILILIIITIYTVCSFYRAATMPIFTWDSFATAIYNAKIIYYDRSLASLPYFAHPAYPLHIPMIASWVSFNLGQWNDQLFKITFPLTLLAFLLIYTGFLLRRTNRRWTLLGILMLLSSNLLNFHAFVAYRDLPLMFYNCLTIIFLLEWKDQDHDGYLILAALFSGIGTFVKQEGMAYLLIHALVMLFILLRFKKGSWKETLARTLKFLTPALTIFLIFYFYKIGRGVSTTQYLQFRLGAATGRVPAVFISFFNALFFTANWNILWSFLAVSILLNLRKIFTDENVQILLVSLVLFFGLLISLSIIVGHDFIIHSFDISRVILQIFPLCPLAIVFLNYPEKNEPY